MGAGDAAGGSWAGAAPEAAAGGVFAAAPRSLVEVAPVVPAEAGFGGDFGSVSVPVIERACSVIAFIAEGRSTMVFSKSAAEAAGCWPGSARYFSLYLPSSMMSLFCRKCFLTALPLTSVPLVLPRSSRNESFRIVTITACSPLTARLSIWMSLCGLRPMEVRSFTKGISLSTNPSMLSISFAIADPWGLF